MAFLFALCAALGYGVSHFLGGLASRRAEAAVVGIYGQLSGLAVVAATAPLISGNWASLAGLTWGALSGVGTGVGVTFLYRGLAAGNMSVVSPLSEIAAVLLPVFVGISLGERPSPLAFAGVGLALPGLWLISRGAGARRPAASPAAKHPPTMHLPATRGAPDGLLAGAGFALQFIALAQVPEAAGLWPLVAGRLVSAAIIGLWIVAAGLSIHLPLAITGHTIAAGSLGTIASLLFMMATRDGLLALAAALASLYPAIPVFAGYFILRERISATQAVGLISAAFAVVLIGIG